MRLATLIAPMVQHAIRKASLERIMQRDNLVIAMLDVADAVNGLSLGRWKRGEDDHCPDC